MGIWHAADDGFNHCLSHLNEILDGHGRHCHAIETMGEFMRDVLTWRRQHLCHRSVIAQQIDNEGGLQVLREAFVRQQVANIEQVTRVLRSNAATSLPA